MLLPLLLATAAARPPAVPPPPPASIDIGDPVDATLFLEGFDMVWDRRPHRLRRLGVAATGTAAEAHLRATAQGGTWATGVKASDVPRLRIDYAQLSADGVRFVPVRVRVPLQGRAKGPDRVDVVPERTVPVEITLPPGTSTDAVLLPWLTGLDVSTLPSHEVGYTPHALSVTLGAPQRDGDTAVVQVYGRVEAAPVPDRNQQLQDYRATVLVELVLVIAEDAQAERVHAHKTLQRSVEPVASPRRGAPFRVPMNATLPPDTHQVVMGLSGFSIEFGREGPTAGRYLRALTVGLRDPRVDPARGTWTADADLRMSNAGELSRAIRVHGEIDASLLLLPRPVALGRGSWSPEAGTGCASWPALAPEGCPVDPGAP
jgi:hypothetical protein